MKKLTTVVLLFFLSTNSFSQFDSPKRELRGVWIAALGIDWPSSQGTSPAIIQNQKNQLISIFDSATELWAKCILFTYASVMRCII